MNASVVGLAALIATSAAIVVSSSATAQNYPTRPITVVYPFAPGGSGDIILRAVADKLGEALGQPIIIESRPGAGTTVGARSVAKSNPDGYTLLSATNATVVIAPSLYSNVGYVPRKDFVPIGMVGQAPSVLVVHPSFAARSVAELIDVAKRKSITFGSPGIGTPTHLSGELLASMAKIKLSHIPYRGAPQALADVLGGHIDFVFSAVPNVRNQIKAGTLRALAVSSSNRVAELSDIATVSESGLVGFDTAIKYYLLAPANTPSAVLDKLNATLRATLRDQEVRRRFAVEGYGASLGTLEEFADDIGREEEKWLPLVRTLGLKAQ